VAELSLCAPERDIFATPRVDRVKRGTAVLNREVPGWFDVVNPDDLDMSSVGRCVLGQLFGDFSNGMNQVFADFSAFTAASCGFALLRCEANDDYWILDALWRSEIVELRRMSNQA
jgi:hypothetical protein